MHGRRKDSLKKCAEGNGCYTLVRAAAAVAKRNTVRLMGNP
jgi:hypothetical protein